MDKRTRVLRRSGSAALPFLMIVILTLSSCSSSPATSTTSLNPGKVGITASGSAPPQIATDWEQFFSGATPAKAKIKLLQNGSAFAPVINAQASSSLARSASANVIKVVLDSPTLATVHYNILLAGKTVLPNEVGKSFKIKGRWLIGSASFCTLLLLEGTSTPACGTKG